MTGAAASFSTRWTTMRLIPKDRFYIMEHGQVVDTFANADLAANMDKLHNYLGV